MYKNDQEIMLVYCSCVDEELERKAYLDLVRYARWLARMYRIQGHWLLNTDDIIGETMFALARCIRKYLHTKPYDQFLAIARQSMRNAIGTLRYKATLTHRRAELSMLSLDSLIWDESDDTTVLEDTIPGGVEPEGFYDSMERMEELVAQLNEFDIRVLNAILGGELRVASYLFLHRDRMNWVFKNPAITVNAYVVARALMEPERDVKESMDKIRSLINHGQD